MFGILPFGLGGGSFAKPKKNKHVCGSTNPLIRDAHLTSAYGTPLQMPGIVLGRNGRHRAQKLMPQGAQKPVPQGLKMTFTSPREGMLDETPLSFLKNPLGRQIKAGKGPSGQIQGPSLAAQFKEFPSEKLRPIAPTGEPKDAPLPFAPAGHPPEFKCELDALAALPSESPSAPREPVPVTGPPPIPEPVAPSPDAAPSAAQSAPLETEAVSASPPKCSEELTKICENETAEPAGPSLNPVISKEFSENQSGYVTQGIESGTVGSHPVTAGDGQPATTGSRPTTVGSRPTTQGASRPTTSGSRPPDCRHAFRPRPWQPWPYQASTSTLQTVESAATLQTVGSTTTLRSDGRDAKALETVVGMLYPHSKRRVMLTKKQLMENASKASEAKGRASVRASIKLSEGEICFANFKEFLIRKYRTPARAWYALDDDGNMNLGELEFRRACQRIGYRGNINAIWKQLDKDTSGSVTLLEIDSTACATLAKFKAWSMREFPPNGDARKLFYKLDSDGSGQLSYKEFRASVKDVGFQDEASVKIMFQMMDRDGLGFVSEDEMMFLDRFNPPLFLLVEADAKVTSKFKTQISKRFSGQKLRAWCCGLDKDRSMRVSWTEFMQASSKYLGPNCTAEMAAAAWRDMDSDFSGFISLREWDEESFAAVLIFRRWAVQNFKSCRGALKAMDTDGTGLVSQGTFLDFCSESNADLILLFRGLDVDDSGTWAIKEVAFLDKWDLKAEGYDLETGKKKFQRAVNKAQNVVRSLQGIRALGNLVKSELRPTRVLLATGMRSIGGFQDLCLKTYGSMVKAWRAFDKDYTMMLHQREFCDAIEKKELKADRNALWCYFNRDVSNMISLLEFDAMRAEELAKFKRWYSHEWGEDISLLFEAMGMGDKETATFEEFRQSCAQKGFSGSLDILFELYEGEDPGTILLQPQMRCLDRWQVPIFLTVEACEEEYQDWKHQLIEAYDDEPLRAWIVGLDVEKKMYVCWKDFEKAYQKLAAGKGVSNLSRKKVARAWRAMDVNLDGWVSLREFDAHIFGIVRTFKRWADANYGNIKGVFDTIDDDGNGRLSFKELAGVAYNHVPELEILFHGFDPRGSGVWFQEDLVFLDEWDVEWEDDNS